jgi:competence protein ComEC
VSTVPTAHLLLCALCAGLVAANVLRAPAVLALVAGVLVVGGAYTSRPGQRVTLLAAGLAVAGWWLGSARLDALDRSVLRPLVGTTDRVVLVSTAPARVNPYSVRVMAHVERFGERVLRESALLQLPRGRAPPQGARLSVRATVRLPRQPNSGFDEREWLRRKGVHVVLEARAYRIVGRRGGLAGIADAIHARLVRTVAIGLHGERRGVIQGIVLGEDESLTPSVRDAFRASGLYHLLAVSGSNVALVVGGVLILASLLGVPRLAAEIAALAALGGYVLAVGWQPSVVRAGVAGGLASLAWLCARERDRWWFFLAGALVLLAWNPYTVREPGFQLSFAAVAAIFVAVPRFRRVLEGYPLPERLRDAVAISTACGLVTSPILLVQFGQVPLYSVPANALGAPVAAPILGLSLIAAGLEPVAPAAATVLAWLNGWLAAYLAACARVFAGLPFAVLATRELVALVALVVALAFCWRLRAPRGFRVVAIGSLLALVGVGWTLARQPSSAPTPNGLRITFLDVGQGDGCLLEAPGVRLLVDEGPPEARVADQLRRLGVRWLTGIVLTHPQRDHVGGAAEVLRDERVGFVLDPRIPYDSSYERGALHEAAARHVPVVLARAGLAYRFGRLRVTVLWPDESGPPDQDPNQHAIVLLVSYGEVDALLTADAESDVTLPLAPPPVEILKVGHHGSADEGLPELLDRIRPRVAVISVGLGNDYGHPAPSTLATLRAAPDLSLYRTDLDGRVVVESDGGAIRVREER